MEGPVLKPRIVVDVDGVLFNFTKSFAEWFSQHNNFTISDNPQNYSWYSSNENKNKIIQRGIAEYVNTDNQYFELMSSDVPNCISELKKKFRVILVTAYPNREMRKKQLYQSNIEYDELHFTDRYKSKYIKSLGIEPVFCIEDDPSIIRTYSEAGWKTYVPTYWNYTDKRTRLDNVVLYDQLLEVVQEQLSSSSC